MTPRLSGLLILGLSVSAGGVTMAQDAANQALPLKDVVLFSSGVGYFEREGRVNGDATVDLSFRAEKINDILKSLVVLDPTGSVRPVTYTTKDAVNRRLHSVGQSLNQSVSLGALLRGFQGARVRLTVSGGQAVEGRVVSVSIKALPVKDAGIVQTEVINVLTTGGLRAIPLDQVEEVKLLDEKLDRELRESLELLATGLDDQRQSVQLRFSGNGARSVRAGYLQESPVWKTSYRLVLDAKEKPYLQGWAIVENTTDEDWKEVRLSLFSGRPISFIQDLYQPLYVPRPVVQAQVIGSPRSAPAAADATPSTIDRAPAETAPVILGIRAARLLSASARSAAGGGGPGFNSIAAIWRIGSDVRISDITCWVWQKVELPGV
ncbi:MAG: hypothetical protein ACO1SX_23045 [Actinomycetota bacterium]